MAGSNYVPCSLIHNPHVSLIPMSDQRTPADLPLDADDPRISEWLDGRLPPAEAAAIERAVQASPELVALVDDLRMIRGAMQAVVADEPPTDFGDRVMAALALSSDTQQAITPGALPREAASGRSRRLPWMALAGALAAGLLVTVVVNFPEERGREVALAPPQKDAGPAINRKDAQEKLRALAEREAGGVAPKGEAAPGDYAATEALAPRAEFRARKTDRDNNLKDLESRLADADAPGNRLANDNPSSDPTATGRQLDSVGSLAGASAAALPKEQELAEGSGGGAPSQVAAARGAARGGFSPPPPSTPAPAAPAPAVEELAKGKKSIADEAADETAATADDKSVEPSRRAESRQSAKRAQAVPAAVLVIVVGSPSERRALDHLVAASGLEVTPTSNHLELVGSPAAIDTFFGELEDAGLVSAASLAGRRKQGAKESQTSVVLRIVERKTKAPPTAGENKP